MRSEAPLRPDGAAWTVRVSQVAWGAWRQRRGARISLRPETRCRRLRSVPDLPDPDLADAASTAPAHRIRSFVVRAGRIGPGQARALATLAPRFVLPFNAAPADFAVAFGRAAPLVVEIGFGMGSATAALASASPQTNFLGIEVHPPGVGALLQRIDEAGLANIRIVQHDAVEVLERMVAAGSLAGVNIFFPDPWHKKRHHKRRLVQAEFVRLIAERLADDGILHCATDWQPYAEQMLEVLGAEPTLANTATGYAERPDWRRSWRHSASSALPR